MKTKNMIIAILISVILIIVLFFYFVLKNSTKDVSKNEPYIYILGTELVSIEDAIYIKREILEQFKEYPFELEDYETIDTSRIKHTKIPKGSVFQFEKAIRYKNAVSGFSSLYLLGYVTDIESKKKINIIYRWGSFKVICISEPCNYWEHRKAPWQNEIDSAKYFEY